MKVIATLIAASLASTAFAQEADHRLEQVQSTVHAKVRFLAEQEGKDNWRIPNKGYGDCEDFALLKRLLLIQEGWQEQDLKIILVYNQTIGGHAALWVKSADTILDSPTDNRREPIRPIKRKDWLKEKGYEFVCVFADISEGDKGTAVSRRCEKRN